MAESSGPWAAQPLPDNLYQRLFSNYGEGVFGNVFGSASVAASTVGDGVVVQPFEAVIRGRYYRLDAAVTVKVNAPSSLTRTDRLVVRFDPAAGKASLAWVQGTPGANGTYQPPALTQSFDGIWEMPHAQVTVRPTAPIVSDVLIDHPMLGFPSIVCNTIDRPGTTGKPTPRVGQPIFDVDLMQQLFWDGAKWINPAAPINTNAIAKMQKYALAWPEPNPANPTFNSASGKAILTTAQVFQSYPYSIGCYVQAEVGTKTVGTRWDLYVEGNSAGTGPFLVGFTVGAGGLGSEVITPQTTVSVPAATAIIAGGSIATVTVSAVRAYGTGDGKIPVAGRSLVVYTIPA